MIVEKCKKAVTDFTSAVTFDPENRPGVSNLISIHSALTDQSPAEICEEVNNLTTAQYKLRLAEVINEHFKPIREKLKDYQDHPDHLSSVLQTGTERAREIAAKTLSDVHKIVGFR